MDFTGHPTAQHTISLSLSGSIDRAYNTSISDIIFTGDFNFNMQTNCNNNMKYLIQNYNLK